MVGTPSTNGSNGRDASGRFATGNAGGPGNPHAKKVARLRSRMLNHVADDDFDAVVSKLIEMAKAGDLSAIKELLDRLLGRPDSKTQLDFEAIPDGELDGRIEDLLRKLSTG
ncbi:hypothetical protein ACFL2H_00425 [Planctomycetota bacterium]